MGRRITRQPGQIPIPSDLILNPLTEYVYRHFSAFLSDRERCAERFRTYQIKTLGVRNEAKSDYRRLFKITEIEREHPELIEQLRREGTNRVMAAAAERIVHQFPKEVFLNTCPQCGQLCRTPVARQCLACGHDWHALESAS